MAVISLVAVGASGQEKYIEQPMPEHWQARSTAAVDDELPEASIDTDNWWRIFDDNILDALIAKANDNNYNARIAMRRIEMARNQLRSTYGGYMPQVSLGAGWSRSQSSGLTEGGSGAAYRTSVWDAALSASWEIDVFGRVAAQSRESRAALRISKADMAGTLLSLQAQIATTYIDLRQAQCQKQLAQEHAASQDTVVKMTEARYKAGLASLLDVTQAKSVYFSTISQIPLLDSQIGRDINTLATLCGTYAEDLGIDLEAAEPRMPQYHFIIAKELPSALLNRRPDVYSARLTIEKDAAAAGLAKKAYLPALSLTGAFGTTVHDLKDFGKKESLTWSVAPRLSWTVFDGLQRKYNVAIAKEQMMADIDAYNLTLITAVSDVNDAMRRYRAVLNYLHSLDQVVLMSQKSLALSTELYKLKLAAFLNVAQSQMTLLQSQNTQITAQANAAQAIITLCQALGGGWQAPN